MHRIEDLYCARMRVLHPNLCSKDVFIFTYVWPWGAFACANARKLTLVAFRCRLYLPGKPAPFAAFVDLARR